MTRRRVLVSTAAAASLVVGTALVGTGLGATALAAAAPHTVVPHTTTLSVSLKWAELLGAGSAIVESSPNEATLDGSGPSVVVGSRMNGCVYAVHLADGSTTPGWGHICPGDGIDSTPSVTPAGGGLDDVVVSEGNVSGLNPPAANAGSGGLLAFGPGGNLLWNRALPDAFGTFGSTPAVPASPAIGDTGAGSPRIVVGDVGLSLYSLDPGTGATEPGWPQKTADTTFATAAIANVNGAQSILAASDSTAGPGALDNWNGGAVRLMGAGGTTAWTDASNDVVSSGPVVGNLTGSGPVAVYGHGAYWGGSDQDGLTAVDAGTGATRFEAHLGGYTLAAPALADLHGNGQLDVIEPSWRTVGQGTGGTVFAFDPNGNRLWSFAPQSATTITGSVSTADFGEGYQDVVAATGLGWYIIDGQSGAAAAPVQGLGLNSGFAGDSNPGNLTMQNAPLIVPDPSGSGLDVVICGTYGGVNNDNTQGFIAVYHVTDGASSSRTVGSGAWPQYKHDAGLTGSTIAPAPPPGTCNPDTPPCTTQGYLLAAADGGLFSYGATNYQGSVPGAGAHVSDIVGIAPSADGGGYYMVGADGGVFAFGDAAYHGSMGGTSLSKPVVGMAVDRATGGYWLVASDGGIFAFDAPFLGSMGGAPLNRPVVGMAPTPDGGGYWLVASDGGLFAFGDAAFHGSMGGSPLNKPMVGMAVTPSGHGYWMVATDGGIFAFGDAGFYGSMGKVALNKPVVGIAATRSGAGYWEVASDGGIFNFGDAYFRGSAGNIALSQPVVGLAATG
ncbi:MAG TPA: hypothetical protein VMV14_05235 [Acidimicrobiales bacterium]|nr:hypothetical protein [Acidimicrobiales bacterium]